MERRIPPFRSVIRLQRLMAELETKLAYWFGSLGGQIGSGIGRLGSVGGSGQSQKSGIQIQGAVIVLALTLAVTFWPIESVAINPRIIC